MKILSPYGCCFVLLQIAAFASLDADCEFGSCPNVDPNDTSLAVITAGNSGVGKSFLDNLIVGEEVFVHKYQASSVTRETEAVVTNLNGKLTTVYNIPGLVESKKENVALNKIEIEKAFLGKAAQVIVFVFGVGDGGRIRNEDYASYLAMNEAYEFSRFSLVFVLNNVRTFDTVEEREQYQAMAVINLKELLGWPSSEPFRVVFAETFQKPFALCPKVAFFRMNLIRAILSCNPFRHEKKRNIELDDEKFEKARIDLEGLKNDYETLRVTHRVELQALEDKMHIERVQNERRLGALTRKLEEASKSALTRKLEEAAAIVAASRKKHRGFGFSFGPLSFQIDL